MNLFHRHNWMVFTGSGLGRFASHLRVCQAEYCHRIETRLFDIQKNDWRWVEGNFFENIHSPVFIVAETQECYKEALGNLHTGAEKSIPVMWVKDSSDMDQMRRHPCPRFFLAEDWMETELAHRDEFRILCMTGHF